MALVILIRDFTAVVVFDAMTVILSLSTFNCIIGVGVRETFDV